MDFSPTIETSPLNTGYGCVWRSGKLHTHSRIYIYMYRKTYLGAQLRLQTGHGYPLWVGTEDDGSKSEESPWMFVSCSISPHLQNFGGVKCKIIPEIPWENPFLVYESHILGMTYEPMNPLNLPHILGMGQNQPSSHRWKTAGWWYTYPSEKWWSSSVGMMTFPIWWESHNPFMFQSTNQLWSIGYINL